MHEQTRVKALLTKMQGNTATLAEIQAITDIDPLVVRAALVDLQKKGGVYFTGKVYGRVFADNSEKEGDLSIEIFLEKADEHVAKCIKGEVEPKDMTRAQLAEFVEKTVLENIKDQLQIASEIRRLGLSF